MFTPPQKLEFLTAYENACESNEGGAFLRREGLYSSQMTEWRRLRDAGVLAGKSIGKLSADQAENARLRRQLKVSEGRLKKTEAALELMGKLQACLESTSEDMPDSPGPGNADGHVRVDAGTEDTLAPGSIIDGGFQDNGEQETGPL